MSEEEVKILRAVAKQASVLCRGGDQLYQGWIVKNEDLMGLIGTLCALAAYYEENSSADNCLVEFKRE